jgi:uncharacterized protein (DUF488 family)
VDVVYTIGYGGRKPEELVDLLRSQGVATVVDVRLRPDRASMGAYVQAKSSDKGIERLLGSAGIGYVWLAELGNVFLGQEDWAERYARLIERAGDLLTERLGDVKRPFCLLCAEKRMGDCHRRIIADHLTSRGWTVEHIE